MNSEVAKVFGSAVAIAAVILLAVFGGWYLRGQVDSQRAVTVNREADDLPIPIRGQ